MCTSIALIYVKDLILFSFFSVFFVCVGGGGGGGVVVVLYLS